MRKEQASVTQGPAVLSWGAGKEGECMWIDWESWGERLPWRSVIPFMQGHVAFEDVSAFFLGAVGAP